VPADDPLGDFLWNYRYTSADIMDFAGRCGQLVSAAMNFYMRLNTKLIRERKAKEVPRE
jgi:hypothetical protein